MKYLANIDVMPLKALLDPQGKAVTSGLKNLGFKELENVRVGKHITMEVEASSESEAQRLVEKACKELLVNQVMESYEYKLETLN
ncbi:MAG TPA: phosphoribosylformylglycinamidine synthase [Flavobacteriales bacterium]|jgi:phosphoribosylformylglycinamidine synthase PurS subunit|nr:phosphoribosylformylglycinamidine synthase [Flavobacteriales bacterium]